jgi:hypothetical protein
VSLPLIVAFPRMRLASRIRARIDRRDGVHSYA